MGEHKKLFKNILIPISSEFYSKKVLERGVFLSKKFNSAINLVYIIEEKTFSHTDRRVDSYRTATEKEETKKELINTQKQAADNIVFNDAKQILKEKGITTEENVINGEFSDVIKQELMLKKYDLILMGFEKECTLNYRLLEDVDVPVWIEGIGDSKRILAVCTNLAPNKKVPEISIKLAQNLGWELHMLYVADIDDSVHVDEHGKRSEIKTGEDLTNLGKQFLERFKDKKIKTRLAKGSLEKETIKTAEKINANLVIVGREQKKKGKLGFPVKNLKKKLAEKCKYSLLFLN
jgi:nucleotide-binding universal stress UspA family protein